MNAIQKLLSGEENAHWINQYNKNLKNYPQGMLSREAYSWADADEASRVYYFTPTVEELLIAIINDEEIYTKDGCELRFTYAESVENRLIKFLEINNKLDNDYFINTQLYKLKLPKYRHYIKCAKCMKEHSRFYDCTLTETRQKELANLYKESEEDIFKNK